MKVLFKLLLAGMLLFFGQSLRAITALQDSAACDSIFLNKGGAFAVKELSWNDTSLQFVYCNDLLRERHAISWKEVARVKKADGLQVFAPAPELPLTADEINLESQVSSLSRFSKLLIPLLFLGGIGVFLTPVVLLRVAKLQKLIKGHAHEAQLRKRIENARKRAMWIFAIYMLVGILFFWLVASFFAKFEHM